MNTYIDFAKQLKNGLVVTHDSLDNAVKETRATLRREGVPGIIIETAIGMILNSVAKEIEGIEQ